MSKIIDVAKTVAQTDAARITAQVVATGAALVAVHLVTKKIENRD
jgi:hypothetical protein